MRLSFNSLIQQAKQSLGSNKLRAVITLMIIALGIMALVGINTSIEAIKSSVTNNFNALGANAFTINSKIKVKISSRKSISEVDKSITKNEYLRFLELYDLPSDIGVFYWASGNALIKFGNIESNPNVGVLAINENYLSSKDTKILYGRDFSNNDINSGQNVCILGLSLAQKLFVDHLKKMIDTTILINAQPYRLLGILEEKGSNSGKNIDNSVLVTLFNARRAFPSANVAYEIIVNSKNKTQLGFAIDEATGRMRQARKLRPKDEVNFQIETNEEMLKSMKEQIGYLSVAAAFIGGITLLGAVIGLMNIMLVSVVERTKEIGLLKALGASEKDIKYQFLTESIMISLIGGTLGILLGLLVGNLVGLLMHSGFVVPWFWIILGFVICFLVGLVAGIYPAIKASKLHPIQALRYE